MEGLPNTGKNTFNLHIVGQGRILGHGTTAMFSLSSSALCATCSGYNQ